MTRVRRHRKAAQYPVSSSVTVSVERVSLSDVPAVGDGPAGEAADSPFSEKAPARRIIVSTPVTVWADDDCRGFPSAFRPLRKAQMNKKLLPGLLAAITLLILPACSDGGSQSVTVTETTTAESPDRPNPTPGESSRSEGKKADSSKQTTTRAGHMGYTGAPTGDPTPINKSIARCAKSSEGLYEQGTTWFTDGTSGWTQYCSNNFHDGPPPVYEPQEPYAPPPQNTPSPWVQGQIDWSNCLESGKSEEQCRAELN